MPVRPGQAALDLVTGDHVWFVEPTDLLPDGAVAAVLDALAAPDDRQRPRRRPRRSGRTTPRCAPSRHRPAAPRGCGTPSSRRPCCAPAAAARAGGGVGGADRLGRRHRRRVPSPGWARSATCGVRSPRPYVAALTPARPGRWPRPMPTCCATCPRPQRRRCAPPWSRRHSARSSSSRCGPRRPARCRRRGLAGAGRGRAGAAAAAPGATQGAGRRQLPGVAGGGRGGPHQARRAGAVRAARRGAARPKLPRRAKPWPPQAYYRAQLRRPLEPDLAVYAAYWAPPTPATRGRSTRRPASSRRGCAASGSSTRTSRTRCPPGCRPSSWAAATTTAHWPARRTSSTT